jgi:hypothetical protein
VMRSSPVIAQQNRGLCFELRESAEGEGRVRGQRREPIRGKGEIRARTLSPSKTRMIEPAPPCIKVAFCGPRLPTSTTSPLLFRTEYSTISATGSSLSAIDSLFAAVITSVVFSKRSRAAFASLPTSVHLSPSSASIVPSSSIRTLKGGPDPPGVLPLGSGRSDQHRQRSGGTVRHATSLRSCNTRRFSNRADGCPS